jgi:hypothetical protein
MQMVYKAKDLHDAMDIRDLLARSGIAAHLAEPASEIGPIAPGFIRVSVDNERLDAARRAIAAWYRGRKAQHL